MTYWSQYKHLFEAWEQDRFYNGPFGAFMEFMTHERSLSLLSENGRIAHMVRYGEPAPDFSVAEAAGLALEAHEQLRNGYGAFADAFVFKRQE